MKLKSIYLGLLILGTIIPYYFFLLFLITNGIDINQIWQNLTANYISIFFMLDVLIAAICLLFLISSSKKELGRHWILPILATLFIGISAGLPLFLYLREK